MLKERFWRKKWLCGEWPKYLLVFLLPVLVALFAVTWVDNDSWYVLAEGREIVENGIYKTDVLSMHEGLKVTVQNYGFAAVFWLVYSFLGLPGLYAGMIGFLVLMEILLYKIYSLLSEKNKGLALLLTTLTGVVMAATFAATRAQMFSYVTFLSLIYVLELYVKSGKVKYLYFVPLISFLQINVHASLWLMLFLVMGVFVIDALANKKYKAKPIIVAGVIAAAVGLLNPYGVDMIWLVLRSYMGGSMQRFILELQPFSLGSWYNALMFALVIVTLALGYFGDKEEIKLRYLLLFLGLLGLGLNTVKGMSQVLLVCLFSVTAMYRKASWPELATGKARRVLRVAGVVCAVLAVVGVGWKMVVNMRGLREGPDDAMVAATDKLDEEIEESERKNVLVYSGFNDGGYLEFRGYRPYIDPRAEVFMKINNGKEDILDEWTDVREGLKDWQELLEKYEFRYLVVRGDYDPLNREELDGYEKIFEDKTGTTTRVFRKS